MDGVMKYGAGHGMWATRAPLTLHWGLHSKPVGSGFEPGFLARIWTRISACIGTSPRTQIAFMPCAGLWLVHSVQIGTKLEQTWNWPITYLRLVTWVLLIVKAAILDSTLEVRVCQTSNTLYSVNARLYTLKCRYIVYQVSLQKMTSSHEPPFRFQPRKHERKWSLILKIYILTFCLCPRKSRITQERLLRFCWHLQIGLNTIFPTFWHKPRLNQTSASWSKSQITFARPLRSYSAAADFTHNNKP